MLIKHFVFAAVLAVCGFALAVKGGQTGDVVYGTVELPIGFRQVPSQGLDSTVGDFVSEDDKLVIHYDIGGMAGIYAKPENARDGDSYTEFQVGEHTATMIVSSGSPQKVVVSISGVNLFADVRSKEDIATVKRLAATFTPNPPKTYPRDNIFERLVDQYIADERAGEAKYQKTFWQAFYRKLRAQTSVGWTPTAFRSPTEMIEYIKQRRLSHHLPIYDDQPPNTDPRSSEH